MTEPNIRYVNTKPEYVAQSFFSLLLYVVQLPQVFIFLKPSHRVASLIGFDGRFFSLLMWIHLSIQNIDWRLNESTCVSCIWEDLACRCTWFANLALISVDSFMAARYTLYIRFHGNVIASLGLDNWRSFAVDNPLGCCKTPAGPALYTFATCVGFFFPLLIIRASYSYAFAGWCFFSWKRWKSSNCETLPQTLSLTQRDIASKIVTLTRKIRAAKTLAIVISALTCCWFPFFVILMALF